MKKVYIGIDLGSSNTSIYSSSSKSIIFNEPTCVAIDNINNVVKEIGFLANKIQGKTPYNFDVIYPVRHGLIEDDNLCYEYLAKTLNNIKIEKVFKNFTIIFSCPSSCSKVNQDALINIGKNLQAKEVYLEPQGKLAALGASENVYSPCATLVCNIGSGLTDIALVSMGEIVSSTSTFISSSTFDEAIRRYMSQKQHLDVGLKTAEYIKMRVGDVSSLGENQLFDVKGRDTITSLPSSMVVSSSEIGKVLAPLVDFLALKITDVIADVEPELVSDLLKNGIILTGGGALLGGIASYLSKVLSLPVRVAKNADTAVINGMEELINKLNEN